MQVIDGRRNQAKRHYFQCVLFQTRDVVQREAFFHQHVLAYVQLAPFAAAKEAWLTRASQKRRLAELDGDSPALWSLESRSRGQLPWFSMEKWAIVAHPALQARLLRNQLVESIIRQLQLQ